MSGPDAVGKVVEIKIVTYNMGFTKTSFECQFGDYSLPQS